METIWRCKNCGSTDIEEKVWRKFNPPFDITSDAVYPFEDIWCPECEEYVDIYEDTDQLQKPDKVLN